MSSHEPVDSAPPSDRPLSARDPRLATWRGLLTAHARLVDRLDEELRAEAAMSLADYSALLQLAEAPDHRLRMSQLAEGVFLTRSGVTRLIDRLSAAGFVTRSQCLSDGRGAEAVLSDEGLVALRVASRTHLRGIKTYFLDRVGDDDLVMLGKVMADVAAGIAEPDGEGAA